MEVNICFRLVCFLIRFGYCDFEKCVSVFLVCLLCLFSLIVVKLERWNNNFYFSIVLEW